MKACNMFTCKLPEAFYAGSSSKMEEILRAAYQSSTGVDSTASGAASLKHGIVVDKVTNKFMATYKISDKDGSISKIFASRQDAEFWFDSIHSLMMKGRLHGNLATLRQTEATRKATAATISKIMEENITLESESREAYKRDMKDGKDLFDTMFKRGKAPEDAKVGKIRFFKSSLDQLQDFAQLKSFEGVVLGGKHPNLGWRPTTCVVLGDDFDQKAVDEFMQTSGLALVGLLSAGNNTELPETTVAKLVEMASQECKTPFVLHFVQGKFKISTSFFEYNPDTKIPEEVTMELISRRLHGESLQVLGVRELASKVSGARSAANWF